MFERKRTGRNPPDPVIPMVLLARPELTGSSWSASEQVRWKADGLLRPNPAAWIVMDASHKRSFVGHPATSAWGGEQTLTLRPQADVPPAIPESSRPCGRYPRRRGRQPTVSYALRSSASAPPSASLLRSVPRTRSAVARSSEGMSLAKSPAAGNQARTAAS